jgi:hypothetical protein
MQEVASIALFDPASLYDEAGNLLPVHKLPESARRAIASIETDKGFQKLKMNSKLGGLELAAKILGLVKQQEQDNRVQVVVLPSSAQLPAQVVPILPTIDQDMLELEG